MGDPAGIGPEIILKALSQETIYRQAIPMVIGDGATLDRAKGYVGTGVSIRRVTAPLNKEAIHRAGYPFAGHTEIFAERTASRNYSLMLVAGRLRVLHVSTHVSLREACDVVKKERVLQVIRLAHEVGGAWNLQRPRIAVAGLNPHAGEQGLFGREERDEIGPAVEAARAAGIDAKGPLPPDTLFFRAARGEFDFVVAMYHDQGHIAVKLRSFDRGVNVTVGLPIIRTSVDHGTAFDIAGKGTASPRSLLEAVRVAIRMARHRRSKVRCQLGLE
jgi:4-hydroxythreonine-4-phosphate dehydrogenase